MGYEDMAALRGVRASLAWLLLGAVPFLALPAGDRRDVESMLRVAGTHQSHMAQMRGGRTDCDRGDYGGGCR